MKTTVGKNIEMSAGIDLQTLEKLAHLFGICLHKLNLQTRDIDLTFNTTKVTGYTLSDLPNTGYTKDSMIYDEDKDLVYRSIESVVTGRRDHYHIEYRMRRKDSSIVWIEEVGLVSGYGDDGQPLYVSAIAADLSRLRWAEEKARSMEIQVKRLSQKADIYSLAEKNRLLLAANAAAAMIIGGFHQDYETLLNQALQMLGESIQADYACIWRNTEIDGSAGCFMRVHWTKKAHASDARKDGANFRYDDFLPGWRELLAENRYAALCENSLPEGFMRECGMSGAKSIALIPLYLHGEFWGTIGFARQENKPFEDYEAEAMLSGALIVAGSVSRNETLGRINMDRDKAVANTLAKGEFLSRMSHELRTPLNAIIGMTAIALREKDPDKVAGHLQKVEVSSRLLLNIINDVLDMSKIDAGKLEITKEPFDFRCMLKNAENIVRVKIDEKRQRFTLKCDEAIDRKIISDEHRLLQVIVNLLNNATKFTDKNGEISLSAFQKPAGPGRVKLRVEVRDNGIGITSQQQERLFTAFEQADGGITRKYGGTGLGLAICKKILNALGGDVWVISKPGQGSCFFFELEAGLGEPLDTPSECGAAGGTAEGKTPPGGDVSYDWRGRRILLAEDVEINREIAEAMLADTGVSIECAENGKEAVEKYLADTGRFDLILMDIQMPVLDGLAATGQIRASNDPRAQRVPVIAMTANAFKEDIDICIKAGMNDHIAKPITFDAFLGVLNKYLG